MVSTNVDKKEIVKEKKEKVTKEKEPVVRKEKVKEKESDKVSQVKEKESVNVKREIYYTPDSAFQILEPFLQNNFKAIWDPAAGLDKFPVKDYFEQRGFRVVTTDIALDKEYDFFTHKTKKRYDIIVTTPPYSYRKEFIVRAFDLKKPFAMLVPVSVLESSTIRNLCRDNGLTFLFPAKRTDFTVGDNNTNERSVRNLPYSVWAVYGVPGFEKANAALKGFFL